MFVMINRDFPHPADKINWLVFVVEAQCVFCEVRGDFLINFTLQVIKLTFSIFPSFTAKKKMHKLNA
jgi:hypothetical protein